MPLDPAIFLDRDGTLVPDDERAGNVASIQLVDGVAPALRRLRDAGFRLVVATNQGGVAHGRFTEADVDAYHRKLSELLDAQGRRVGLGYLEMTGYAGRLRL